MLSPQPTGGKKQYSESDFHLLSRGDVGQEMIELFPKIFRLRQNMLRRELTFPTLFPWGLCGKGAFLLTDPRSCLTGTSLEYCIQT